KIHAEVKLHSVLRVWVGRVHRSGSRGRQQAVEDVERQLGQAVHDQVGGGQGGGRVGGGDRQAGHARALGGGDPGDGVFHDDAAGGRQADAPRGFEEDGRVGLAGHLLGGDFGLEVVADCQGVEKHIDVGLRGGGGD